jgi:hypothetical protein
MQRVRPSARTFWLILFAASISLAQTDSFAAPPWGTGEKPSKGKPNKPPTIEGTPATTAEVDEYYAFQPSAQDRDKDPLTFSISAKPAWAAFDTSSGFLSGYPGDSDAGTVTNSIVVSVSDGTNTTSLSPFSLSVADAPVESNSPPVISGSPPGEVVATEVYNFTPSASDPDNDTLNFSAINKPTWASLDSASGRLHGTPGDADVGLYENIRISVSDGTASAETSSFTVAVVQTTSGVITLDWLAPTQNVDGTPLTDLAGYRIYYGNVRGQYDYTRDIDDAGIMTVVIDNLTQGTWYFAATALNSSGLESDLSGEVEKLVQ